MSAKWLGVEKVKLATIGLPGGFAKRKKEQHVHDLAASIKDQGVISLPVIDAKTRKLVAGGDRLAALMLNKVTQHEVRLVQGTPAELEAITLAENVWRRRGDDYDAMVKRLVELAQGELPVKVTGNVEHHHKFVEVEDDGDGVTEACECGETRGTDPLSGKDFESERPGKPGRPKTEKGAAREEVAKQLGKTPEAVRQAEKRAKAKEREAEEAKVPEEQRLAEKPPVTTYGVPLSVDDARAIIGVQVVIDAVDSQLRRAQSTLASLKDMSIGAALYRRIQSSVHQAADVVRRERPDSVCPCCKRIPVRLAACAFCGGTGVVSNDKLVACAPELLVGGDKAVVPDGRGGFLPYAREAAGGAPVQKPAPAKKTLQVKGPDGQPVQLPPADDIRDDEIPF